MKNDQNLLIVDDNKMNVELLKETLSTFGLNIMSYNNPVEALEASKNHKFELALLDVVMPDLSGFEFAEKFLETHQNTPIIFVSAHGTTENKLKGYKLGSIAYIEKPYDINTIRAQVANILNIKLLQDELFAEKEKLDNIFAFASDEIILTDVDFNITSKNHRVFIGGVKEQTNFFQILEKYKQEVLINIVKEFSESDEKYISFRMTMDDTITNTKISKIMDKQNMVTGYLIMIMDISDEIRYMNQKEQFIATLTHDLKTPIRAESKALELLMNGSFGPLSDEQYGIIVEIYNSSKFMARMTDNLLTRYKIDAGEICLQKEINSIKMTIQKCAENLKYILQAKNQILKINIDIEDDKFLYDDLEISRAVNNLLTNSSEYSNEGTEIVIQVVREDDKMNISVIDAGTGIPPQEIKTIFNEHATSAKKFKKVGAGIGLFITKKIVEAHGGNISVISESGKGSCFTISLPYCITVPSEING